MSKLIDRVVEAGLLSEIPYAVIESIEKIEISNISKFMYELSGQEDWTASDFPNIAPPHREFWIATAAPKTVVEDGVNVLWASGGNQICGWGFLVIAFSDDYPERAATMRRYVESFPLEVQDRIKWVLLMKPYLDFIGQGPAKPEVNYVVPIDEAGRLIQPEGGKGSYISVQPYDTPKSRMKMTPERCATIFKFANPMFLALSFMHVKNREIVTNNTPDKLQKARVRRGKLPLFSYRTIVVDPIRKMLIEQGKMGSSGIKMALHKCRGHFKEFTDKPLFGKFKGSYWWDPHLRGRENNGVSEHDYEVRRGSEAA